MALVHTASLSETLDAVSEALFLRKPLSKAEREAAARWIAGRQGLPGSYASMFAPTERDRQEGIRLFTGERFATRAGSAHVLGEEACRALILLDIRLASVRDALARATEGMIERLRAAEQRERSMGRPWLGQYCCAKCTAALWRHLAAGGLEDRERHLAAGVATLGACRDGVGRWCRFPFHYTLLALSEIELPAAVEEMRYAAPVLERSLRRPAADPYTARRRALAERVLGKC